MISKRKTVKYQNGKLPASNTNRFSMPNIYKYQPSDHSLHGMIKAIIHELVVNAEREIDSKEKSIMKCGKMMAMLDVGLKQYFQMNFIASEPHAFLMCETEPTQIDEAVQPKDLKALKVCRKKISLKSHRFTKEKSQSLDFNEQFRKKDKFKEELQHMRKCSRNELISLTNNMRISQNQGISEEIQELLRRKKQLLLESQQAPRANTEASKVSLANEKKEKKAYGQNDEGEVFQLLAKNPVKLSKEKQPAIKLSNIKVLPGQQVFLHSSMRKKPIIELPTTRRTKKRKEIGDTCVLIEQMYEQDCILDHQQLFEQSFIPKKGVKCEAKDKSLTTILKLPTLR